METLKVSILFFLIFLLIYSTKAQDSKSLSEKRTTFAGIFVGYNQSTVGGTLVEKDRPFNSSYNVSGKQVNGDGFLVYAVMQRQFTKSLYLKYGLGYIQKQINPEENSYELYKDSLKTGYIFLPVLAGFNFIPFDKQMSINLECGPAVNIKVMDKSSTGPDRVDFKTKPIVISACFGAGISYWTNDKIRLSLNYQFITDLTEDYVEYLYWNSLEPRKALNYKFKTNVFTIGIQWQVH